MVAHNPTATMCHELDHSVSAGADLGREACLSTGQPGPDHLQTILVVDDEPAFCAVVCEILFNAGYHALQATSVREARRLLEEADIDLLLSDIMMPDTHGLDLVRSLRNDPRWRSLPVIVASAKADKADYQAALEAGANGFLAKPFSAEELREAVKRHLKR